MADSGQELGIDSYYRSFSAGSTLYYAGAPADTLFLIRDGRVRLLRRARGVERTTGDVRVAYEVTIRILP